MLYVLVGLVVVLAMVAGVEYAMLRVANAESKAEVARLKCANFTLAKKLESLKKLNAVKEGLE